jgi:hypothetical protein
MNWHKFDLLLILSVFPLCSFSEKLPVSAAAGFEPGHLELGNQYRNSERGTRHRGTGYCEIQELSDLNSNIFTYSL